MYFEPVKIFGLITIYCLPDSLYCVVPLWFRYLIEIIGFLILYLVGMLIINIVFKKRPEKKP